MSEPTSLLDTFRGRGALLEGHFQLSSGRHSPCYLQCALLLTDPPFATRLGAMLAEGLKALPGFEPPAAVVSPALGGVVIGHEVARALGCRALFAERQDGVMILRRGFTLDEGDGVVVVEDVVTTGGSTREVMSVVAHNGARTRAVGCLVDRGAGGVELGVPLASLLSLDVPSWSAEQCPLCREGSTPERPGSRPGPRAT